MAPPTRKGKRRRQNAKPRHPHTISPTARSEMLEQLMEEGMSLQDADRHMVGIKRFHHGASPPFLPGDTGSKRKARKKPKKGN